MTHISVQKLFQRAAAAFPQHNAIECAEKKYTYAELEARSNRLGNFLRAAHVAQGTPIVLLCDDAGATISSILAVLKAGCVFVPLDIETPAKRLQALIREVEPTWFLTESRFLPLLTSLLADDGSDAQIICVDDTQPSVDAPSYSALQRAFNAYDNTAPLLVPYDPDSMCYIYFTSGTTGRPKGIAGRLKALDHFINWETQTFGIGPDVRVSQLTTPSFDAYLRNIFVPLCMGGTVCVPENRETILDTAQLIRWIDEQLITLVHCVPSLLRAMLRAGIQPQQFAALRHLLVAGEPLLPGDVKRWLDVFGERITLANLYGPTETTMVKFAHVVQCTDVDRPSIPIGRPIDGARAIVVDSKGRPCLPGVIGEIYIRTEYRSLGYYKRADLTREVFIPNPFSNDPNDIVYKTGDLGRMLEDGLFEFLGRRDQQVKIRGARVELSEIEDQLHQHPAVQDVVVVARPGPQDDQLLCAYVVFSSEVATHDLHEYLLQFLPAYMLPTVVVPMEELPRLLNGKVDLKRLPAPTFASRSESLVAPRTPMEEALVKIWREVLGVPQVSVTDNFFEMGGHSLLATQVTTRIRKTLGHNVPLRNLFTYPTIATLAAWLQQEGMDTTREQTLAITATFTAEPVEEALRFWMEELDLPLSVKFAGYNQVLQQLLDPTSLLATNADGINLVLMRFEDCLRFMTKQASDATPQEHVEHYITEFLQGLRMLSQHTSVPCVVGICPPSPRLRADVVWMQAMERLEARLAHDIAEIKTIAFISSQEMLTSYVVSDYYDAYTDEVGHIPFTPHFFAVIATLVARKVVSLRTNPYKVIVVDCDQTLWQGVCGEDGPQGVVVDAPRRALQEFLVAQQEAGMLICLCSKNAEQDVLAVFEAQPDMPLRREHLASWYINWSPKSQNLRTLAQDLNLSLDSLIVIDDSQVERAEIIANCPEVLVFPFPQDVEQLPLLLQHFWAFDHRAFTQEDRQRTRFYQQEQQRQSFMRTALSLKDFLAELDLRVSITPLTEEHLARAAQLTQRTNQFNMTTVRRTENEIRHFCQEEQGEGLVVHVQDRFGDYGLVGLALYKTLDDALAIDTFLLSCRVLGRGVEHKILAFLGARACECGLAAVSLAYLPTTKNQPAYEFLQRTGAAYKLSRGESWLFAFPAQVAADVCYQPPDEQERKSQEAVTTASALSSPPDERQRIAPEHLVRIVTELNTIDHIIQRIRDRKQRRSPASISIKEPQTQTEEELQPIWAEVLGLENPGVDDNFFALGGHSLLATQLVSRMRNEFLVDISLHDLFEAPTIAQMGSTIERMQREFLTQMEDDLLETELASLENTLDDEVDLLLRTEK